LACDEGKKNKWEDLMALRGVNPRTPDKDLMVASLGDSPRTTDKDLPGNFPHT
jgi:hypothetical protein